MIVFKQVSAALVFTTMNKINAILLVYVYNVNDNDKLSYVNSVQDKTSR